MSTLLFDSLIAHTKNLLSIEFPLTFKLSFRPLIYPSAPVNILLFLSLLLPGCVSTVGPEPEEKETYTWQGTLYKGLGEEPWGNANLTLVGQERKGSGIKYHTLASGETDVNGNFVLNYEWERDWHLAGEGQVDLEVNGGYPIMWAPWNVNVDRQICQRQHVNLTITIVDQRSDKDKDSLFLGSFLFGSVNLIKGDVSVMNYVNENGKNSDVYYFNPITDTTISIINEFSGTYDNSPSKYALSYTTSKSWLTVEDKMHYIDMQWRGFPYKDSVTVTLTD